MRRVPVTFSRNISTGQYAQGSADVSTATLDVLKKHADLVKTKFDKLLDYTQRDLVFSDGFNSRFKELKDKLNGIGQTIGDSGKDLTASVKDVTKAVKDSGNAVSKAIEDTGKIIKESSQTLSIAVMGVGKAVADLMKAIAPIGMMLGSLVEVCKIQNTFLERIADAIENPLEVYILEGQKPTDPNAQLFKSKAEINRLFAQSGTETAGDLLALNLGGDKAPEIEELSRATAALNAVLDRSLPIDLTHAVSDLASDLEPIKEMADGIEAYFPEFEGELPAVAALVAEAVKDTGSVTNAILEIISLDLKAVHQQLQGQLTLIFNVLSSAFTRMPTLVEVSNAGGLPPMSGGAVGQTPPVFGGGGAVDTGLAPDYSQGRPASTEDWWHMGPGMRQQYQDDKARVGEFQTGGPRAMVEEEEEEYYDFPMAASHPPSSMQAKIDKKAAKQARQSVRDETEGVEDQEGAGPTGNKFLGGGLELSALPALASVFTSMGGPGFSLGSLGLGGLGSHIGAGACALMGAAGQGFSALGGLFASGGGAAAGLGEAATGGAGVAAVGGLAAAAAPLIPVFTALASVLGSILALYAVLKISLALTNAGIDLLREGFVNTVDTASEAFGKLAQGDVLGVLATGASFAVKGMEMLGTTVTDLIPIFGETLSNIIHSLAAAFNAVANAMTGFVSTVLPLVQKISPATSQNYNYQVEGLQATLGLAFTGLVATMADAVQKIAGELLPLAEEFQPLFTQLGGLLRDILIPAFKVLGALIGSVLSVLRSAFDGLRSSVMQVMKIFIALAAITARLFGVNDFFDRLREAFSRTSASGGALPAGPANITGLEEIGRTAAAGAATASMGAGGAAAPDQSLAVMREISESLDEIQNQTMPELMTAWKTNMYKLFAMIEKWWDDFKLWAGQYARETLKPVIRECLTQIEAWLGRLFGFGPQGGPSTPSQPGEVTNGAFWEAIRQNVRGPGQQTDWQRWANSPANVSP